MNTNTEDQDVNSAYNPFPEPQTIPAGWDFAALTFMLEDDAAMNNEDDSVG